MIRFLSITLSRLFNIGSFLITVLVISSFAATNLIAQENLYDGFVGKKLDEYDGIVNINAQMRLKWTSRDVSALFCSSESGETNPLILKGLLSNAKDGWLNGALRDLKGRYAGDLTLTKRIDGDRIIWEGTLSGGSGKKVRMSFDKPSPKRMDPHPLIITDDFISGATYIPQELFVYAYPKFDRFETALGKLDQMFPYWRESAFFCDTLEGHFTLDYDQSDVSRIGEMVAALRATGFFEYVELGVAEYGGMPEQVAFSGDRFHYRTSREFSQVANRLSNRIAAEFFCGKACNPVAVSTKSWNSRVFEIEGRSEDLFFKRARYWEKYTVSMTFYANAFADTNGDDGKSFNIQFYFVEGALAPSGTGNPPSANRYRENLISADDLSNISSKIQKRIASALAVEYGAEYQEEF